jgi:hypothetical protein
VRPSNPTPVVGAGLCAAIYGVSITTAVDHAPKVRSYNQRSW